MAISLVQHASSVTNFTSGTSGTATATFSSPPSAGNCLIICFSVQADVSVFNWSLNTPKTGSSTDNWGYNTTTAGGDGLVSAGVAVDPNTNASSSSVSIPASFGATANSSNTLFITMDIFEFSGILTISPADQTANSNTNTTTNTSWTSTSTATTTQANELWIGVSAPQVFASNTTQTVTGPSSPWINETVLSGSYQDGGTGTASKFFGYQISGYQIVSSTGTATYSGTNSQNSVYDAAVLTLKAAAAGTNVSLTVAQVNIAAPAPGMTISVPLTVAQVNVAAPAPGLKSAPSLTVAQVNVNAPAPGVKSTPSLAVAQVNITAYPVMILAGPVSLAVAQVNVNAHPLILGKEFDIPVAEVNITAWPLDISRGVPEDTIVPLMATGVYSNV